MIDRKKKNQSSRIYFLDHLRTLMVFLVVLLHSGNVYESSGLTAGWWLVDDPATNNWCGMINIIMDIFVMSIIFFIAGYFASLSLKNKNTGVFLKSKIKRLLLPWLLAVLILIPLYKMIFLASRGLAQENWTTYFHWSNGIWSQNWLWFLPVLFLFNLLYLILTKLPFNHRRISLNKAVLSIFVIGFIYSFLMDIFNYQGWTKTILLDFQNERLLIYFLFFLLGTLSDQLELFQARPGSKKNYFIIVFTVWIPVIFYGFLVIYSIFKPDYFIFSRIIDSLLLNLSFHISLFGLVYVMINTFRYFFNKPGPISRQLNQNSYGIYIIHTVVLGLIALVLLNTAIPSLFKYLILTVSTYGVSLVLVSLYRKLTRIKRVKL